MSWRERTFDEVLDFYDYQRVPLSTLERDKRKGEYRYFGAQGVIDYIDDFIFDGQFILVAEDGANLVTRNEPIAFLVDGKFWVNNHAHIVRGRENEADNYYITLLLNNLNIAGYVTGAAQPKLSQKSLRAIRVRLPSYDTQRKIAAILSTYDDLIENNLKRIRLLEESARLVFREWFVRLCFPGHEHTPTQDGVPEGWEKKKLGDVLTLNYGKALKQETRQEGAFPVYGSSGVIGTHDAFLVQAPGIIVGRKGNVGSVFWSQKPFFPIDTVYYIDGEQSSFFLYHNLQNRSFMNSDGAVPGLNRNYAYSLPIVIPSKIIREQFEEIVAPVYQQIFKLEAMNEKLKQARDLLLPRLMSGELPV